MPKPDDRDVYVPKTPPPGVVTSEIAAEASGAIEDPDARRAMRANRSPDARFAVLEDHVEVLRQDIAKVSLDVAEHKVIVARLDSKLDTLVDLGEGAKSERMARREREKAAERRNKIALAIVSGVVAIVVALVKAVW